MVGQYLAGDGQAKTAGLVFRALRSWVHSWQALYQLSRLSKRLGGRITRRARAVQMLASVEAAKQFLRACAAMGKASPDCHFWRLFGAGDVSGAHENIKRRAGACARRANIPPSLCAGRGACGSLRMGLLPLSYSTPVSE